MKMVLIALVFMTAAQATMPDGPWYRKVPAAVLAGIGMLAIADWMRTW